MIHDTGSTVPRRQLGRALRQLRTEAQMALDGVADALQCSRQKMWRIETGVGGDNNGACVEVADNLPGLVAVRDSKDLTGPTLIFSPDAWTEFIGKVKTTS